MTISGTNKGAMTNTLAACRPRKWNRTMASDASTPSTMLTAQLVAASSRLCLSPTAKLGVLKTLAYHLSDSPVGGKANVAALLKEITRMSRFGSAMNRRTPKVVI